MPLSEEEIQRYSRQILLMGVGGVGQAKLLAGGVEIRGEGPALDTAAAYLVAGGCPVRRDGRWEGPRTEGVDPRGPKAAVAVALLCGVTPPPAGIATVRIGHRRLAYRSAEGCEVCFRTLEMNDTPPQGAQATLAGTLAALLCQKLIWGTLTGVGSVQLDGERALTAEPAPPCPDCKDPS